MLLYDFYHSFFWEIRKLLLAGICFIPRKCNKINFPKLRIYFYRPPRSFCGKVMLSVMYPSLFTAAETIWAGACNKGVPSVHVVGEGSSHVVGGSPRGREGNVAHTSIDNEQLAFNWRPFLWEVLVYNFFVTESYPTQSRKFYAKMLSKILLCITWKYLI